MSWFKKRNPMVTPTTTVDPAHSVEIIAHKDATKQVVRQANAANEQLKKLFDENGFTVKIVLAMGAKTTKGNG